jgi:hypothetical protein
VHCGARSRRALAGAAAAVAGLTCAAPGSALAAGEPQILAAGIDATDRPVVSWRLAPETTFAFLEFSSVPIANPFIPGGFAGNNTVASVCAAPAQGCVGTASMTVFRAPDPVARDRRYYVKVNARGSGRTPLSSDVWVIDAARPQRTGGGRPTALPTNMPVLGLPYVPPARGTIPAPRLALGRPPRTIGALLRDGVRARVRCPDVVCYVVIALKLGTATLVFSDATAPSDELRTFVLRPRANGRARLRRRSRARLTVVADVMHPGTKRTQLTRRFSVRR